MAIRTNTNTDSLNSLNALRRNQGLLSKAFERLSSGLRINSAADDAAGLSISSRFGAQIRGLNQAIRNTSDGVSLTQTTDAALGNSGEALQRIRELAVQAANGTLSDADRDAIQSEVSQLQDELDRIGETTTFNGRKLLDGSAGPQSFQVGANANESVSVPGVDARSTALGRAATVQGGAEAILQPRAHQGAGQAGHDGHRRLGVHRQRARQRDLGGPGHQRQRGPDRRTGHGPGGRGHRRRRAGRSPRLEQPAHHQR